MFVMKFAANVKMHLILKASPDNPFSQSRRKQSIRNPKPKIQLPKNNLKSVIEEQRHNFKRT